MRSYRIRARCYGDRLSCRWLAITAKTNRLKPPRDYSKSKPPVNAKSPPGVKLPQFGRPKKYLPEYAELVERFALLGMDNAAICKFFGITPPTLKRWDDEFPEFRSARVRGREPADAEVAAKLQKRAVGYTHKAVKIFMPPVPAGQKPEPVIVEYDQHYPPDTMAANIWLMNRQPLLWKPRRAEDPGTEGGTGLNIKITGGLPDE
jgi:hypothetical protein